MIERRNLTALRNLWQVFWHRWQLNSSRRGFNNNLRRGGSPSLASPWLLWGEARSPLFEFDQSWWEAQASYWQGTWREVANAPSFWIKDFPDGNRRAAAQPPPSYPPSLHSPPPPPSPSLPSHPPPPPPTYPPPSRIKHSPDGDRCTSSGWKKEERGEGGVGGWSSSKGFRFPGELLMEEPGSSRGGIEGRSSCHHAIPRGRVTSPASPTSSSSSLSTSSTSLLTSFTSSSSTSISTSSSTSL